MYINNVREVITIHTMHTNTKEISPLKVLKQKKTNIPA